MFEVLPHSGMIRCPLKARAGRFLLIDGISGIIWRSSSVALFAVSFLLGLPVTDRSRLSEPLSFLPQ